MAVFTYLLFVAVLVHSVKSETRPEEICSSPTKPPIKFIFSSHRNSSGHWLSQIEIERLGERQNPSQKLETTPWSLGVEQRAVACGGIDSSLHVRIDVEVPPPLPGQGYALFPGLGYYKFHTLITNWDNARHICAEEGAHLIIINSEQETEVAKTLYARYPKITNKWAWVGICEEGKDSYYTLFGDAFTSTGFTRWVATQPNDAGADDCLVVQKENGGLEDTSRKGGFPFICEHEIIT